MVIDEARLARAIDQGEIIRTEALSKTYPGGLRAVDGLDLAWS